jgi:condensin complex subunit 1
MQDFLVMAAERLPHVVLANISVLLPLLDVDCYPLRSAIVQSIGQLLAAEGKKLPAGARSSVQHTAPVEQEGGDPNAIAEDASAGQASADVVSSSGSHFSISEGTKKELLETLMTRSLDKSVWVRYRALQTLNGLASNRRIAALPHDMWVRALEIATRRMQDTASTTRKASMQLVRTLIEFHPYGPALQGSGDERAKAEQLLREIQNRHKMLNVEEVAEAEQAAGAAGVDLSSNNDGDVAIKNEPEDAESPGEKAQEQPTQRTRLKKKTVTDQTIAFEVDKCLADADEGGARQEERTRQREALKRMSDCYTQRVRFVELIDSAETRLRALLSSRTATDVTEAISVVVALRLGGLPAATHAFDQVLGLVWSRTDSIRDAAVDAFHKMHLEDRSTKEAIRSLLEMYQEGCSGGTWTYTHMASVQELLQQAAEKELIDPSAAIPELVSALEGPACPMALRALTALGAASSTTLASMLPRISELVGPRGTNRGADIGERLERARLLGLLLQRLNTCIKAPLDEAAWGALWNLSEYVTHVVLQGFASDGVPPQWFGTAQVAMDLSFDLAMSPGSKDNTTNPMQHCPDKAWEQIVNRMLWGMLGNVNVATPVTESSALVAAQPEGADEREADSTVLEDPEAGAQPVSSAKLGCAVFLAGHLALRMLVFLEGVQSSMKRKRLAEEDVRMAAARDKKEKKKEQKDTMEEKEENNDRALC